MIGFVNGAFENWVTERHGAEAWRRVAGRVETSVFIGPEDYDDDVTADLARAVAAETGLRVDDVLASVGEHLGRTAGRGLDVMLGRGESSFRDVLRRLPDLQTRLELVCPTARPQRFTIVDEDGDSISIVHASTRADLAPLFAGTVGGLASAFGVDATVSCRRVDSGSGVRHEYRVHWQEKVAGRDTSDRPATKRAAKPRPGVSAG